MTGCTGGRIASAWWVCYIDASGRRVRKPAPEAQNHDEAGTFRADERREVREHRNLKPGEVLVCRDSFADVADKYLAYQKPRLTPKAYNARSGDRRTISKHSSPASWWMSPLPRCRTSLPYVLAR